VFEDVLNVMLRLPSMAVWEFQAAVFTRPIDHISLRVSIDSESGEESRIYNFIDVLALFL
jgi:hypothetical protein